MRIAVNLIFIIPLVEYCTGEDKRLTPFKPLLEKVSKELGKAMGNVMTRVDKCLEQRISNI